MFFWLFSINTLSWLPIVQFQDIHKLYLVYKASFWIHFVKMFKQNQIKYILASSVFFFFMLLTVRYNPEKTILSNELKNEINFIQEYPNINPEKCLESSPFHGGE